MSTTRLKFIASFSLLMTFFTAIAYALEVEPILKLDTSGHMDTIRRLAITNDGRYLISASDDKTIRVWDTKTLQETRKILGYIGKADDGKIYALALSPDNHWLAVGGVIKSKDNPIDGSAIRLYDFTTNRLVYIINSHKDVVYDLAFSPDGRYLASGSKDGTVRVWDMNKVTKINMEPIHVFRENSKAIMAVRIFRHGGDYRICRLGQDARLILYSLNQKQILNSFSTRGAVATIAITQSSGKGFIASVSADKKINIFDIDLNPVKTINSETQPAGLAFSPDGGLLLAGHYGPPSKDIIYDVRQGFRDVSSFTITRPDEVNVTHAVAFLDNHTAISGGGDNHGVYFWDARTGKKRGHIVGAGRAVWSVGIRGNDLAFGKIGKKWMATNFGMITYTRVGEGLQKSFNLRDFSVSGVMGSYDMIPTEYGKYSLQRKDNDTVIEIRKSGAFVAKISRTDRDGFIHYTPGFTADGIIISGGASGHLTAYDLEGRQIAKFVGHTGYVFYIAVDGDRLVSGSSDQTIRVWDLKGIKDIKPTIDHEFLEQESITTKQQTGRKWSIEEVKGFFDEKSLSHLYWKTNKVYPTISLFVSNDDEWVAWTDGGYFHASETGAKYVGYHINQGIDKEAYFLSLNNLYDVFYRPDIVMAKLKGEDISGLITLTAEQALKNPPPTVKFTSLPSKTDQQKVRICYQAQSNGGGIGEIRVFHNAKLVHSDGYYREVAARSDTENLQLASFNSRVIYKDMRGVKLVQKIDAPIVNQVKGDKYEACTEIEAVPGENDVSIAAFNDNNTVQSILETANFKSTLRPQVPHLYILAIGIDDFKAKSVNLKYASKDALDFQQKMIAQAASIYGKNNIHFDLLQNVKATKDVILEKINQLSKIIKPGDGFIFFVASHGVLVQNQYYIVTHDYSGTVKTDSLISSNEIVEMSKKIRALNQLYIFDTCHAGGVDVIISGLYDARMSVLAKKMGLHVYASASGRQAAMDGYKGNGLFTYTLLDGLNNNKRADKYKDGNVSITGLGEYSKKMTTNISKQIGHEQTPLIINFGKDSPLYKLQ